ncbi:TetR family transcriptional regulator [Streptomyces sp. NPDC002138]|uniref:TetR family transcriptional regulator n=1 Tax=Streptomyces sp. NPDC002138 TaxID=3154410 RepID=UPI00331F3775
MARARQERAEITRQAILDGAAIAFDRSGFGATSLSDVVQHAGVTKGALYFHLPSKEALARTLMDEQFQVAADVPAVAGPGLQTAIDLSHQMAHALRTTVRIRGDVLPHLDAHDLAAYLIASFTDVRVTSRVRTTREDLHARVTDLWTFLLPGITPTPRIPFFDPAASPGLRAVPGLPAPDSPAVPVG